MQLPGTYTLDREALKLDVYRLVCLFRANKEIARTCDPKVTNAAQSQLEHQFFPLEMSRLLLSISMVMRTIDDQMNALPSEDPRREAYEKKRKNVNDHYKCIMWFDEMTLREVCNKIIHATLVEPHTTDGEAGDHEIDRENYLGWSEVRDMSPGETIPEPETIVWQHLTCNIRLGGQRNGKEWFHLLDVFQFTEAVYDMLED